MSSNVSIRKQDPNAGNSRVADCRSQLVPIHGHRSRTPAYGARYDFLLVFLVTLLLSGTVVEF